MIYVIYQEKFIMIRRDQEGVCLTMLDKVIMYGQKYGAHILCFAAGAAVGYWAGSPSSEDTRKLVSKYEEDDQKKIQEGLELFVKYFQYLWY